MKNKSDNGHDSNDEDSASDYEDEDSGEDVVEIKIASNLDNKLSGDPNDDESMSGMVSDDSSYDTLIKPKPRKDASSKK